MWPTWGKRRIEYRLYYTEQNPKTSNSGSPIDLSLAPPTGALVPTACGIFAASKEEVDRSCASTSRIILFGLRPQEIHRRLRTLRWLLQHFTWFHGEPVLAWRCGGEEVDPDQENPLRAHLRFSSFASVSHSLRLSFYFANKDRNYKWECLPHSFSEEPLGRNMGIDVYFSAATHLWIHCCRVKVKLALPSCRATCHSNCDRCRSIGGQRHLITANWYTSEYCMQSWAGVNYIVIHR